MAAHEVLAEAYNVIYERDQLILAKTATSSSWSAGRATSEGARLRSAENPRPRPQGESLA